MLYGADSCVASSIREGFGLNLVEALGCGLPVVVFKNWGYSEIVEDGENGYLIEQGNVIDIAKSIEKILFND